MKKMSTYREVSCLFWDWKEQIDIEALSKILEEAKEPLRITEIDTKADYYQIVIHPPDWKFTSEEWEKLFGMEREETISLLNESTYKNARRIFEEGKKQLEAEESKEEDLINETYETIVSWSASGQGNRSGPVYYRKDIEEQVNKRELSQSQKERVWEILKEHFQESERWTLEAIKVVGEILGIKKIEITL